MEPELLWVDLYITHPWAQGDFLIKGWAKLAWDALIRDCNNAAHADAQMYARVNVFCAILLFSVAGLRCKFARQ